MNANIVLIEQQIHEIKEILPHLLDNVKKFNEDNIPLDVAIEKELKKLDTTLTTTSVRLKGYHHD